MQYLCPTDTDRISLIPIPPMEAFDTIAWLPAIDGQFIVKRAYQFGYYIQELNKSHPNLSTTNKHHQLFQKEIWNPNILPRLSIWSWQASQHRLPTATELRKIKLLKVDFCTYCGKRSESIIHILYGNFFALEIRKQLQLQQTDTAPNHLMHIWSTILRTKGPKVLQDELITCWKIWQTKNECLLCSTQLSSTAITIDILNSMKAGYNTSHARPAPKDQHTIVTLTLVCSKRNLLRWTCNLCGQGL